MENSLLFNIIIRRIDWIKHYIFANNLHYDSTVIAVPDVHKRWTVSFIIQQFDQDTWKFQHEYSNLQHFLQSQCIYMIVKVSLIFICLTNCLLHQSYFRYYTHSETKSKETICTKCEYHTELTDEACKHEGTCLSHTCKDKTILKVAAG